MSEQSPADSATPEQRIASLFGAPEAAAPEAQEQAEREDTTPVPTLEADDADDAPEQEADDGEDFDVDGENYKVPPALKAKLQEWKDGAQRRDDYTKKTQAIAELRKAVEDKQAFIEAREQMFTTASKEVLELQQKKAELEQLESMDWNALQGVDASQIAFLMGKSNRLAREVQALEANLQTKVAQTKQMTQQHRNEQWKLAAEGARKLLGNVTKDDDVAAMAYVNDLGFTDADRHLLADPRILAMAFEAAKYKRVTAGKTEALSKVKSAPPVVKPGSAVNNNAAESKAKALRARLKTSGNVNDAAALLRNLF